MTVKARNRARIEEQERKKLEEIAEGIAAKGAPKWLSDFAKGKDATIEAGMRRFLEWRYVHSEMPPFDPDVVEWMMAEHAQGTMLSELHQCLKLPVSWIYVYEQREMPDGRKVREWITAARTMQANALVDRVFQRLATMEEEGATRDEISVQRLSLDAMRWYTERVAPKQWSDPGRRNHNRINVKDGGQLIVNITRYADNPDEPDVIEGEVAAQLPSDI